MRLLIIAIISLIASTVCFSQNNELLRSRGLLPTGIFGTTKQITSRELEKRALNNEVVNADQLKVIQGTSRLCNEIIMSGRLMVNDSLSSYANKILDVVLQNDIELRKKLHVYFYYSTGTNAITLSNGMIIIELGLMAHVKNEAQLAFILAHEASHFRQNHFIKYYSYSKNNSRSSTNSIANILNYSRELEQEADSLGYELYKVTGYALSEAIIVFDMLRDSDMPEEQIPFTVSFFEHGEYKFPATYSYDELIPVVDSTYDETKSTHPSIEKRMGKIQTYLENFNSNGNLFIVSESAFTELRLISREECCSIYLEDHDYGNAIYCAYALSREDDQNLFAKGIIGKALYQLAAYKIHNPPFIFPQTFIADYDPSGSFTSEDDDNILLTPYKKVAGESQKLFFFLEQLSGDEITILALDWNWQLYRADAHRDILLSSMCDNLIQILSGDYYLSLPDFTPIDTTQLEMEKFDSILASNIQIHVDTSRFTRISNTKHDIFKKKDFISTPGIIEPQHLAKAKTLQDYRSAYIYRAFDELKSDSVFIIRFTSKIRRIPRYPEGPSYESSSQQRESNSGLGIENFCVLPPSFYHVKAFYPEMIYYYDEKTSLAYQDDNKNALLKAIKTTKTNCFLLDPETMDSTSIEDYNTYCMMTQWLNESLSNLSNGFAMNLAHSEIADTLHKRLGSQYLAYSVTITKANNRNRPKKVTRMQTFVFDLKTGKFIMYYDSIFKAETSETNWYYYYAKVFKKIVSKP